MCIRDRFQPTLESNRELIDDVKNNKLVIYTAFTGNYDELKEPEFIDENFFAYMEDVDLSYRAKINGYKNLFCPDSVVYHIGSCLLYTSWR